MKKTDSKIEEKNDVKAEEKSEKQNDSTERIKKQPNKKNLKKR